jgi:hypothetical protein
MEGLDEKALTGREKGERQAFLYRRPSRLASAFARLFHSAGRRR